MEPEYIIISEGTLRDEDLFEAFIAHLQAQDSPDWNRATQLLTREWKNANQEERSFILNEDLFDLMQEAAPTGTYFSANEGDGACFGYWPIENQDDDAMWEM